MKYDFNKINEDLVISDNMREKIPDLNDTLVKELTKRLKAGDVKFSFRKKETDKLRRAHGTCNYDTIKAYYPDYDEVWDDEYEPIPTSNPNLVRFYDLEKNAWRSCSVDKLLLIIDED